LSNSVSRRTRFRVGGHGNNKGTEQHTSKEKKRKKEKANFFFLFYVSFLEIKMAGKQCSELAD
jgi:hypothetical protein